MYEMTGEVKRPLKVIIYTQFQQVSNLVGDRLIRRFGRGCVAEYWGSTRNIELNRFINAKECFCMLLNRDGSHGLNLSFVTHIFFLDEILDKSLENQVIARAWRMGAAENVNVEQLVARHSIEELIVEMNKRDDLDQGVISNSSDSKKSNSHVQTSFLLKNAKLIRPQNTRARITHLTSSKHEKNRRVKFAD
jgi:SNF2 family DNA or RNA helicase